MSIETHIVWIPAEDNWAVYDEANTIVGFYITYGEALEAFNNYCRQSFPELYHE